MRFSQLLVTAIVVGVAPLLVIVVALAVAFDRPAPGTEAAAISIDAGLGQSVEPALLNEVKKLLASDAQAGDYFGVSVSVSGDTAVVGGEETGAAYIFQRDEGGTDNWGQVKRLTTDDAQISDNFGRSVAVSGDTVVVGAPTTDAVGADLAGAAYVFQRNEGGADNWGQVKRLTASDPGAGNFFGLDVAVSGDTAVMGASGAFSLVGSYPGAAYVFGRNEGGADNWGEVRKLVASDAEGSDYFGRRVAVGGDTAIVGAPSESSLAGAAYVFGRDEGGVENWGEAQKLTASDAQAADFFGVSLAISGDTAVVGATGVFAGCCGVQPAYVFQRDEGGVENWGEVTKLVASDTLADDQFGTGVGVSGDTAVVGAWRENTGGNDAGAAYVFGRDEGGADNWGQVNKLTASDAQNGDQFGVSAAVSGDTAIVGAYQENAGGIVAGAAYVFIDSLCASVPWPVPSGDNDCDGFTSTDEASIGTDPNDPCGASAWPPDFDDNGVINTTDVFQVLPPTFGTAVPPTSVRRDLFPDGVINTTDVFRVLPPFLGGSCTP